MIGDLMRSAFGPRAPERRASSFDALLSMIGSPTAVTPNRVLQLATVYACVRILAESLSMLPLVLYQRDGRIRTPATAHSLYPVLHDLWTPEITSTEARMAMMYWLALHGNAYAQIVRDNGRRVRELWPLAADRMTVDRNQVGELIYIYQRDTGEQRVFARSEILHIRGLSTDGLLGLSPIATARQTFARSLNRSTYDEAFYANGANPGGILTHPGKLSDNALQRLRATWEGRHQGSSQAGKVAILEEGMTYAATGVPQTDQQFLESQKFDVNQIAAVFRIPAHMVNDLERATFANIAEKGQEFVDYTLAPWFKVWEEAIFRDLLNPAERQRYYAKFTAQALLRGNPTERAQWFSSGLQWGWFSINEVRDLEDMNPIDNGDAYFVPLNMVPLDMALQGPATANEASGQAGQRSVEHGPGCTCGRDHAPAQVERRADDDPGERLRVNRVGMARAMYPVLEDAATRLTRREVRDLRRMMDKLLKTGSTQQFREWLTEFYRSDWPSVVIDAMRAPLLSYARQAMLAAAAELGEKPKGLTNNLREFVDAYLTAWGDGWSASSRMQIEQLLDQAAADGASAMDVIGERLDGWEETRPGKTADRHSFEALNAFVIASYRSYGITRIMWVASGESCPFCQALNGRVVGVDEYVVQGGASVDAGDGSPPMLVRNSVRHGPLHGGCDCITVAVRG